MKRAPKRHLQEEIKSLKNLFASIPKIRQMLDDFSLQANKLSKDGNNKLSHWRKLKPLVYAIHVEVNSLMSSSGFDGWLYSRLLSEKAGKHMISKEHLNKTCGCFKASRATESTAGEGESSWGPGGY